MSTNNKTKYIKVRLTEHEYTIFKNFCENSDLSLSTLIRQLLKTWVYSNVSAKMDK